MKPIRGERKLHVIHEPWGSKGHSSQQEDVAHFVSDSGGLESHHLSRQMAFDCGCLNKSSGGFCIDCVSQGARGLTCASCFGHCQAGGCGRPTCRRHSVLIDGVGGKAFRLCRPCYEAAKRKQIARGIVRLILSPFGRFNEDR